ncbi:MAG: hypothetical protein M1114_04120 [Candidatus Dependentiae bacterium]|nr:hypothetical protein [Candidatus Dependentiae bacterium]
MKNIKIATTNDFNLLEDGINELITETSTIPSILNPFSDLIKKLENKLSENNTHIPFNFTLDESHGPKIYNIVPPANVCLENNLNINNHRYGYYDKTTTHLSWNFDEKSKKYRLFWMQKKSKVFFEHNSDLLAIKTYRPNHDHDELIHEIPFIEAKLSIRLKYLPAITTFVQEFKSHIAQWKEKAELYHQHGLQWHSTCDKRADAEWDFIINALKK